MKYILNTIFFILLCCFGNNVFADNHLEVIVNWDDQATGLFNTETLNNTGRWYYKIVSDGKIVRSKNESIYLTAQKVGTNNSFNLCTFGQGAGLQFSVSYPACATGSMSNPQLNVNFTGGDVFEIFFTDVNNNIINSPDGDGKITMPQIPLVGLADTLISDIQAQVSNHSNGGKYIKFNFNINQTYPGESLKFILNNKTVVNFNPIVLGFVPIDAGQITLPLSEPQNSLGAGEYELIIEYNGTVFRTLNVSNISEGSQSGELLVLNTTENINPDEVGGLVPNCGYNIKTFGNTKEGRMCGIADLITLIQKIINYIFILILPIAAIVILYIGYIFLSSGGDEKKRTQAKEAATNLLKGIAIVMSAWLIVNTLLVALDVDTNVSTIFFDVEF